VQYLMENRNSPMRCFLSGIKMNDLSRVVDSAPTPPSIRNNVILNNAVKCWTNLDALDHQ
jgi:hypothetical protein